MSDKEKILAFLEGMSKGCCPNETKEIIVNKIIPWINDLPEEPVSEELEKAAEEFRKKIRPLFETFKDSTGEPVSAYDQNDMVAMFKAGAHWQKEQMKQLYKYCIDNKPLNDLYEFLKAL